MTTYQQNLITEHKELCKRIVELESFIITGDEIETANRSLQINAMKSYEKALAARLCNCEIFIDGSYYNPDYFEHIIIDDSNYSTTPVEETPTTENKPGSDFDKDSELNK